MSQDKTTEASNPPSPATACGSYPAGACSAVPIRFYWKQCYEIGGEVHWALCDTKTDSESKERRVSSCYTILETCYPVGVDGRPVDQQEILQLIAKLLTDHYSNQNVRAHRTAHMHSSGWP